MPRCKTLVVLGTLILVTPALADKERATSKKAPLTAAKCERLVEQMVSPDKPPFEKPGVLEGEFSSVAARRIFRKQAGIKEGYDRLSDNIEAALPVLVKHAQDQRFSHIREDPSGGYVQVSVGTACRRIIEHHVEVYQGCLPLIGPASLWFIDDGCGGPQKWWKARKDKPLAELQIEACEWVRRQPRPWWARSESWASLDFHGSLLA